MRVFRKAQDFVAHPRKQKAVADERRCIRSTMDGQSDDVILIFIAIRQRPRLSCRVTAIIWANGFVRWRLALICTSQHITAVMGNALSFSSRPNLWLTAALLALSWLIYRTLLFRKSAQVSRLTCYHGVV